MQERLDTIREIFNGKTNFADNKKLKQKLKRKFAQQKSNLILFLSYS